MPATMAAAVATAPVEIATAMAPLDHAVAKMNDLLNAVNLIMWDQNVMMPTSAGAAAAHSAQTATLKELAQQLLLSQSTADALAGAEAATSALPDGDPWRRAVLAVRAAVAFHSRIPPALLSERSEAAGLAGQAWVAARERDDFGTFLPHLEKLVDVGRRYALAAQTERHAHPCKCAPANSQRKVLLVVHGSSVGSWCWPVWCWRLVLVVDGGSAAGAVTCAGPSLNTGMPTQTMPCWSSMSLVRASLHSVRSSRRSGLG